MRDNGHEPFLSRCPYCRRTSLIQNLICPRCGFSFAWDLASLRGAEKPFSLKSLLARIGVVIGVLAFTIYFTLSFFNYGEGFTTEVIYELTQAGVPPAPMPVKGEGDFVSRVELALALLHSRAPSYYDRVSREVTSIELMPKGAIEFDGRIIRLTGVAAYIDSATGHVGVRIPGAYLSGLGLLYDRDIFYLAGVLVHEARHRELARVGLNVGGPAEEYECEQTAYDALRRMDAPISLLRSLQQFLANPNHPRYAAWEQYYEQFDREGP